MLAELSCFIAPIEDQGGSLATPGDLTHSERIGLLEPLACQPSLNLRILPSLVVRMVGVQDGPAGGAGGAVLVCR